MTYAVMDDCFRCMDEAERFGLGAFADAEVGIANRMFGEDSVLRTIEAPPIRFGPPQERCPATRGTTRSAAPDSSASGLGSSEAA